MLRLTVQTFNVCYPFWPLLDFMSRVFSCEFVVVICPCETSASDPTAAQIPAICKDFWVLRFTANVLCRLTVLLDLVLTENYFEV
jgi:hypothetical protein